MNDDNQLIELANNGDRNAFATLLERHYDKIYSVAFKWSGNKEDTEDIAQNVCIKLAKAINNFRGDSAFTTWLYRIVINTAKDILRKNLHTKNNIEINEADLGNIGSDNFAEKKIIEQEIWQLVGKLPEKPRDAVLLVYGEELSHKEAACVMGCAESTVSGHILKAKQQLKLLLNGE